ncbi:hypothetical protein [Lysinibacillus sp. SGAir0095]|uniref:hypothetical protein n=1 Tax=Lysinibacillus sp. SGAir0095 TaxID=2070463 RepID=UPI0010CCBDD6|nr:hypothetical protein [Lysinibacillus sp. SGAir0095]QCR31330.1 hypothetical protein C1N55_03770 [Lysinibacillus sp. SGAir0095]
MRVSDILLNNGNFEERKRILQRKEANDAYKKNAIYTQAKKNPMLKVLEDLLSGKTEQELFKKDNGILSEENEKSNASALNEMNVDIKSQEETDILTQPSETIRQSEIELASDEEEHVNRISSIQFEDFNSPEWVTKTAMPTNSLTSSFESLLFEKTYTKAISSYTYQMLIAKNSFQLEQPKFSLIA